MHLVNIEKRSVATIYALSEEGQKYAKLGLPERRLLEYLLENDIQDKTDLKTILSNKSLQMDKKEEQFKEIESELREAAVEKGRKEAQKVFNKAINADLRKLKLDPYDIKPILNPVDFLVFKDMNSENPISDIVFLSKKIENQNINRLRVQVKKVIEDTHYEWLVARIDNTGQIELE